MLFIEKQILTVSGETGAAAEEILVGTRGRIWRGFEENRLTKRRESRCFEES